MTRKRPAKAPRAAQSDAIPPQAPTPPPTYEQLCEALTASQTSNANAVALLRLLADGHDKASLAIRRALGGA